MADNWDVSSCTNDIKEPETTRKGTYEEFIKGAKTVLQNAGADDSFAIVYLDIAGFQLVNDFYGFEEGDRLLSSLEEYLSMLPYTRICGRVFSDHYLHLLQIDELTKLDVIQNQYEKLLKAFLEREQVHHKKCNIYLVGGLCQIKEREETLVLAIDNANVARKMAKDMKHTSLLLFDLKMEAQIYAARVLKIELQEALQNHQFSVFLQPKINLSSGKIVGAEALARWIKRDGTMVSPGVFIPTMELNGTIIDLDFMIYRQVCVYLKELLNKGKIAIPVSVNMSRQHMQHSDTAERIHELVQEYQISPYLLEFELTESILMEDFSVAKQIMQSLRNYGYKVSIDDYGSGYSGVMIFQELNFDVLKLDRTFLDEDMGKEQRNDAIIRGIVPLANELQVTLLCEGIETSDQCERMKSLGCGVAQGYYFSKPMKLEAFETFVEKNQGYCKLPGIENQDNSVLAPEHVSIEMLPDAQARSITQSLLHILPCGIAGFDETTKRILFATEDFFTLVGCTRAEVEEDPQWDWKEKIHTEYIIKLDKDYVKRKFDANQKVHMESIITRKDNSKVLISIYAGRSSSPDWGTYVLCALFDDTNQRCTKERADLYEEYLRIERERADLRMNTTIDMLGASVIVFDFEKNLISVPTPEAEIMEGSGSSKAMTMEEFIQSGIVHPDYINAYRQIFKDMDIEDEVYLEFPHRIGSYEYRWVSFSVKVAVRVEGKPIQCIGVIRFIEKESNCLPERAGQPVKEKSSKGSKRGWKKSWFKKKMRVLGVCSLLAVLAIAVIFIKSQPDMDDIFILIIISILSGWCLCYMSNQQKHGARFENERYSILSEFSDTVLFEYFYKTDVLELTPNAKNNFQVTELKKENYLKEGTSLLAMHSDGWCSLREALENPLPEKVTKQLDLRVRDKTGEYIWCSAQLRFLYKDNVIEAAVGKITNINNRKQREEILLEQTRLDSLTQILNKVTMEQRVAELLERDSKGILIMIDMDNFKQINDIHGHIQGDIVLMRLGRVLREVFRKDDAVGRIGGDEFVVFLPNTENYKLARERVQRIFQHLRDVSEQVGVEVTVSIGISSAPKDGISYSELYVAADQAMYRAKEGGKNQYHIDM